MGIEITDSRRNRNLFAIFIGLIQPVGIAETKILFLWLLISLNSIKTTAQADVDSLYHKINEPALNKEALRCALKARNYFYDSFKKHDTITLIDFSKTSEKERFFVIDLKAGKILFSEITTHGRNSGIEKATDFSNEINSYKSSLGCFKTAELDTSPRHDTVLILDGLEKGINHNARVREIIIHRSEPARYAKVQYCSYDYINLYGYNGQSLGCPTLRVEVYKQIIDVIKWGSMVFAYAEDENYFKESEIFR